MSTVPRYWTGGARAGFNRLLFLRRRGSKLFVAKLMMQQQPDSSRGENSEQLLQTQRLKALQRLGKNARTRALQKQREQETPEREKQNEIKGAQCVICLEPLQETDDISKCHLCNARFHPCCIGTWLSGHNTCPLCRGKNPLSIDAVPSQQPNQGQRREIPPREELTQEERMERWNWHAARAMARQRAYMQQQRLAVEANPYNDRRAREGWYWDQCAYRAIELDRQRMERQRLEAATWILTRSRPG